VTVWLYLYLIQTNLSFVVVDSTSNSIVGGDFLFHYLDGAKCVEHHHCMQPIVDLLRAVEAPARDRLEATGDVRGLVYNFCLFVDSRLASAEHVRICHFIESNVMRRDLICVEWKVNKTSFTYLMTEFN